MSPLRKRMLEELQLRNYSDFTIQRYLDAVKHFAGYFDQSPSQLEAEQIREYLLYLVKERKVAPNTFQVYRAALKFLYVKTLHQPWFDEQVARMRKRPTLPTVLSAEEITRILDHTTNLKHWAIIATFYATGLRCNELRHLKVEDIDSRRMVVHVRVAKGGIPRDIGLSPLLLERLRMYWRWPSRLIENAPANGIPPRPNISAPEHFRSSLRTSGSQGNGAFLRHGRPLNRLCPRNPCRMQASELVEEEFWSAPISIRVRATIGHSAC